MLIYVNITDRQTEKHVKSIVRNLTKFKKKIFFYINGRLLLSWEAGWTAKGQKLKRFFSPN